MNKIELESTYVDLTRKNRFGEAYDSVFSKKQGLKACKKLIGLNNHEYCCDNADIVIKMHVSSLINIV